MTRWTNCLMLLGVLCFVPERLVAQITVPNEIAPYMPIVAGCNCIVPENGEATFQWRTSAHGIPVENGTMLHIWAAPGEHTIEVAVLILTYQEVLVYIPNPEFPNDISKGRIEKRKFVSNVDTQQYSKRFKVTGTPTPPEPTPPPDPPTPPNPPPTGFAAEVRKWLTNLKAAVPAAYSNPRAIDIGNNYGSVAAQALAVEQMYDITAFTNRTRELNQVTIPDPAHRTAWGTHVLVPLAKYQADLANSRGVDVYKDEAGIAKIWIETGEAFRNATITMAFQEKNLKTP